MTAGKWPQHRDVHPGRAGLRKWQCRRAESADHFDSCNVRLQKRGQQHGTL